MVFMLIAPYSIKEKFETPNTQVTIGLSFLVK